MANVAYECRETVNELVKQVLEDFKDYFAVKQEDLVCLIKTEGYMKHAATIRRIPILYAELSGYRLCMVINGKHWDKHTDPDYRYSLIFHELNHVIMDEEGEYRIQEHDIEDFTLMVEALGIHWEKSDNAKIKLRKTLEEFKQKSEKLT